MEHIMISQALKNKISQYYKERVQWMRENNIVDVTTPTYTLKFTNHKGYVGVITLTVKSEFQKNKINMQHGSPLKIQSTMSLLIGQL